MRPVLKPALRRVWRDTTTLQFGLDPERAVVLTGIDPATARFVEALDGTRETAEAIEAAPRIGIDETRAARVLDLLSGEGLLDDASADTRVLYEMDTDERDRLRPDLAALSLVRRTPGDGLTALARRRGAAVHVHGLGRMGAPLAALLAAAGVGHVMLTDPEPARVTDLAPGGLTAEDVGVRRQDAMTATIGRHWRATRVSPPTTRVADLTVLAFAGRVEPPAADRLMRAGMAHLAVGMRDATGVIGPLVIPGQSSCLRCHDLYRADRDPAWPKVAAQLAADPGDPRACDTVLAVAVATQGALQALTFLDGDRPATVNGTLEIRLPEGFPRRRSWQPHYGCGCAWASEELR